MPYKHHIVLPCHISPLETPLVEFKYKHLEKVKYVLYLCLFLLMQEGDQT